MTKIGADKSEIAPCAARLAEILKFSGFRREISEINHPSGFPHGEVKNTCFPLLFPTIFFSGFRFWFPTLQGTCQKTAFSDIEQ